MNWFIFALIGPILYAATNHVDKYILEKYLKGSAAGAIVLFSALFSIVALPIIYFFDTSAFSIGAKSILVLTLNGTIGIFCLILYFKALRDDEASTVIPFTQLIPVFGFILGYFVLGETLTTHQMLACLLVIFGLFILALDFSGKKISIRKKVVLLMLLWSFLFAINDVVFKLVAIDEGYWVSMFWEFMGRVIIGIILFLFIKSYRRDFTRVLKWNSFPVISLNSLNELTFIIADGVANYAILLVPVTLVMTVNSLQPVFVLIFGILLTMFFPRIIKESMLKRDLIQKVVAILLIAIGTVALGLLGVAQV